MKEGVKENKEEKDRLRKRRMRRLRRKKEGKIKKKKTAVRNDDYDDEDDDVVDEDKEKEQSNEIIFTSVKESNTATLATRSKSALPLMACGRGSRTRHLAQCPALFFTRLCHCFDRIPLMFRFEFFLVFYSADKG